MQVKTIMIVGAGQMGSGIAQVAAQADFKVILADINEQYLSRALEGLKRQLERNVERGRLSAEAKERILANITPTIDLDVAATADFIIEAATENLEVKKGIFIELDQVAPTHAILASNTSSISITKLASYTKRPASVIGMHFFNPVPLMQLVEVVKGLATSNEVVKHTKQLAEILGKTPVEINDAPGFAVNRMLIPMINEAVFCLMEGVATAEAIDTTMRLGANHPMGPLALADLVGLDVCLSIMEVLHRDLGDDKYRPCPLLRQMVAAGYLGRKVGRGFYTYDR
ncbi:MAG TPA: 3-hydroxybutyryl-CoA dehydrogenase [Firmicutes bacterium]|jgi:3-hydroxybutyryl-CoA dehydrogenase|nr:3-hydroxybutyryl-CoA dehydrogenase [Bacillota bacterium]